MQAWDAFLCDLEEKLGKQIVKQWLRPLKIASYDACNLYLEAENSFQISWFEEHIRKIAQKELRNNNSHLIKIHFISHTKEKRKKKEEPLPPPLEIQPDTIDPTQTFTNFIHDEQNALTVQFFKELSPGVYNPVFLYGPPGIGKTHLLTACANKLRTQGLSVFYVHAETFTEHVVKAIRNSQMRNFREIYRNQDVLFIDDVHHFARKVATQEELFHTFNTLHTSGKQILLSSHLPPGKIEEVEPRLISRFEWGIVFELYSLSPQKMGQVLKNRARLHHFPLPDPLADFLIQHFSTSSKSMMRALEALMIRHKSSETPSLQEIKHLLADLLQVEQQSQLTPEKILSAAAAYFGLRPHDIMSKSQSKECVFPRKLAMYLCRKKLRLPYATIGKIFARDHSTVMTSIRQIEMKSGFEEIETALEEIEKGLTPKGS